MTPFQVEPVPASDREQASAVIVLAFITDPVARWVYPDPLDHLRYFPELVESFAGGAFEHGTGYHVDGFSGAALWLPPDVHPDEDAVGTLLQRTVPERNQEEVFSLLEQMDVYRPPEPHWYLPLIGVDPAKAGRGYGSALLEHALASCDRENKPAYLDSTSPRNVPLYERYGFEQIGTVQVGSSPPAFPMLRRPRPA